MDPVHISFQGIPLRIDSQIYNYSFISRGNIDVPRDDKSTIVRDVRRSATAYNLATWGKFFVFSHPTIIFVCGVKAITLACSTALKSTRHTTLLVCKKACPIREIECVSMKPGNACKGFFFFKKKACFESVNMQLFFL